MEEEIIISDDDEIMDLAADLQDIDVEDIDEEDELNPLLCAEYVKDIYKYMKKREVRIIKRVKAIGGVRVKKIMLS